jgi:hypothetical protein
VILLLAAFASLGVAAKSGPPARLDLLTVEGRPLTVLLLRIVLVVDGQQTAAFRHGATTDDVTIGISDFTTGMSAKPVAIQFLSEDTRLEGWVYLMLEPGLRYIAVREPISTNVLTYNARWKTCPRWRVEIPSNTKLVYGGTLFLPGKGRWMISGPRQMVRFDRSRIEVRDQSNEAEAICRKWLPELLPLSIQLAKEHRPEDTMIIETPAGK